MLSFSSYGEWSYIGENDNGESKYYIDLKTLRKIDDYVYYWNLIDFDKLDEFGNMSNVSYSQGDCGITRVKMLTAVSYKKPMGEEAVDTYTAPNPEWEYMPPYTVGEFLLNTSCRLVDASYEKQLEIIEELLYEEDEPQEILETTLIVDEMSEQLAQDQKNQDLSEAERAAQQEAFEVEEYVRLLTQEIQAEEDMARTLIIEDQLQTLKTAYVNNISARVRTYWRYQGADDDWTCNVYVQQDENGKVEAVRIQNCNLDNSEKARAFKNSIERAVYKASPLPSAPDEAVFDTEILFEFAVN